MIIKYTGYVIIAINNFIYFDLKFFLPLPQL